MAAANVDKVELWNKSIADIRAFLRKQDPHLLQEIHSQFTVSSFEDHSPEGALRGWVEEQCAVKY